MDKENAQESVVTDESLEDNTADYESGTDEAEGGEESEVEAGGDVSSDDGGDSEGGGDDYEESRQARKDRAAAQIARLKEENKRLKEEKRKSQKEGSLSSSNTDVMAKAFLAATHDIKEPEAQEEALRLADKFDMTVDELMEDPDYADRVKGLQKRLVNQRKVTSQSGNANAKKKGAEYAAEYFKKHQAFPEDTPIDVRSKAIDIISGKEKQAWQ